VLHFSLFILRSFYIYFQSLLLLSVFFHSSPPTYIFSIYIFSYLHHLPQTQCNKPSSLIHVHHPEGPFLPVQLSVGDDNDDDVDDANDPPTVQEKFNSWVNEGDMNV